MKAEHKKQKNEENLSDEIWTNVNKLYIILIQEKFQQKMEMDLNGMKLWKDQTRYAKIETVIQLFSV